MPVQRPFPETGPPRDPPDAADPLPLLRTVLAGGRRAARRALLRGDGSADPELRARLDAVPGTAIEPVLAWLAQPRHFLVGCDDPRYPPLLRQMPSPPLALFVDGDPDLLWRPTLAVVGSRAASAGGRDHARLFAAALGHAGLAVASGMAVGIDAAAHEAALGTAGGTIAVLGTGPDLAYPGRHAALRDRIAAHGAVVSEHPPGTPPRTWQFPGRNRIIAGLSLGTLVVEAALRSGALITARQAAEAGREVFAIPGSIHQPQARGCHRLIRDGAQLVEHPDEVLAGIAPLARRLAAWLSPGQAPPEVSPSPVPGVQLPLLAPSADHDRLWAALGHDPTPMDVLVERSGLTPAAVASMLLGMELDGRVAVEHGRYARRSTGSGDAA